MLGTLFHEFNSIIPVYWDDDLFSRQIFGSHLDSRFRFRFTFDDVLYLVNFLSRKCIFYLDDFFCIRNRFRSLYIRFGIRLDDRSQFKVFEIFGNLIDFLWDLVRIEGGILSMLAGTDLLLFELFPLVIGFTLGVNFAEIFCLNV